MTHTATASQLSTRTPAFTVATALAWLGHDCDGGCPPLAICTPASLWFVRNQSASYVCPEGTLIVVEIGDDPARATQVRGLISEVNHCTRNHVQVRERVSSGHGRSFVARSDVPPLTGTPLYLRRVDPPRGVPSGGIDGGDHDPRLSADLLADRGPRLDG
jgi:hypothetical protein